MDYIKKTKEEIFLHFKDRLKERYNLDITEYEYDNLKIQENFYKLNSNRTFCSIIINNVNVNAVWDKDVKLLRTCLPHDINKLPIPKILYNLTKLTYFNEFVNAKIIEANSMTDLLKLDTRTLFTQYPEKLAHLIHAINKSSRFYNVDEYKIKIYLLSVISTLYTDEIIEYSFKRQEEETL